eukprot:4087841-Prymnesium_polylepis.1
MAARAPPALEDVILGGLDRLVEVLDDRVVCPLRAARVERVLLVVGPRPMWVVPVGAVCCRARVGTN